MKKLVILIVVALTILPFFRTGLFDVHDPTSAYRLYTMVETLKSGQFPAAWSNLLNFGYGYPLHLYYAPLFSYLGALIYYFVGSYEVAVKLGLIISSLVGTYGIYKLLESRGFYASLLGAVAYTYLPYRASALYVRGSYAEFLAMSILPWVIYFWLKPQNLKKVILPTAISTALFILSHNTLFLLVAPIILLIITLFQRQNLKGVVITFLTTIGLISWFILPVLFERSFVQVEFVARITNYQDHFVTLSQLWTSTWGYGGSARGISEDGMSFMIGKGQIILSILGLCGLYKAKKWSLLLLYSFIVLFSVFLSLSKSEFLWSTLHFLSVVQFPWRSLAVVGLGVAVLSGYSLEFLPKKFQIVATLIFSILLIYTNYKYFYPQSYLNYNQDSLSSQSNLDPLVRDKIPEYLPVWMPMALPRSADGLTRTAVSVSGTINVPATTPLVINTAYMPQWHLRLSGVEQPIKPSQRGLVETVNDVHAGDQLVQLRWQRTPVEMLGLVISGMSIIVVIGLLLL